MQDDEKKQSLQHLAQFGPPKICVDRLQYLSLVHLSSSLRLSQHDLEESGLLGLCLAQSIYTVKTQ